MKKIYLILSGVVFCCLFFSSFLLALDKSLVALEEIETKNSTKPFVGKALTQMLLTRLSSEGIDCFILDEDKLGSSLELADFLVSGEVQKENGMFKTVMILKDPRNGKILKRWELRSQGLEALARDISLFSAKLADNIKNTGDVLNTFSSMMSVTQQGEGEKIKNDFELARMHPDVLVRENLEKDEAKEIEQEKKRQEEEKVKVEQQANQDQEDTESWMPIPDPYNKEDDEDTPPKLDPIPSVEAKTKKGQKSWYSWLWPFGSSEEEKEKERKKELLIARAPELNKGKKEAPKIIESKEVPIPPPPNVDFNIPEPVSMDEVYKELEKIGIKEEKEKKRHPWYSWLWPFGEDEEDMEIDIDLDEEPKVEKPDATKPKMASSKDVSDVIGSFTEGISRVSGTTKEEKGNTPTSLTQDFQKDSEDSHLDSTLEKDNFSEKKVITPTSPTEVDGPIWQWN